MKLEDLTKDELVWIIQDRCLRAAADFEFDKDSIDLATLAFNYTDAVWWDSKRGFIAAQAGEVHHE